MKKTSLLVITSIVLVYCALFFIMPAKSFVVCDSGCKFLQVKSLVLSNYKDISINIPGLKLVSSLKFCPLLRPFFTAIDKKIYCVFSLTFAFLSSFPYQFFGMRGLYLIPLLCFFMTLPAIWLITGLLSQSKHAQILSLVVTSFCTPVWFYSLTFWEHTSALCCVVWSAYFFLRFFTENKTKDLILCAVLCGISIYFRDNLLILPVIFTFILFVFHAQKIKSPVIFCLCAGLTLSPLWIFQFMTFGNPLGAHVTSLPVGKYVYFLERLKVINRLLFNSHKNLWLSIPANLPFIVLLILFPKIKVSRKNIWSFIFCVLAIIAGSITAYGFISTKNKLSWIVFTNGFFATVPIFIFSLFKISEINFSEEIHKLHKILKYFIFLYISFYILLTPWEHAQGVHWGCRYFLIIYPLLSIFCAINIYGLWRNNVRKANKILITIILVLSFGMQIYSIHLLYVRKKHMEKLNYEVALRGRKVIVSNQFFTALDLAPIFYDKHIFLASGKNKNILFNRLRAAGIKEVFLVFYPNKQDMIKGEKEIIYDPYKGFPLVLQKIKL